MVSACSINLHQLELLYGPVLLLIMLCSAWLGVSSLCGSLAPVMGLVSWVLSHCVMLARSYLSNGEWVWTYIQ